MPFVSTYIQHLPYLQGTCLVVLFCFFAPSRKGCVVNGQMTTYENTPTNIPPEKRFKYDTTAVYTRIICTILVGNIAYIFRDNEKRAEEILALYEYLVHVIDVLLVTIRCRWRPRAAGKENISHNSNGTSSGLPRGCPDNNPGFWSVLVFQNELVHCIFPIAISCLCW